MEFGEADDRVHVNALFSLQDTDSITRESGSDLVGTHQSI
jgi:hypothetical protein